MQLKTYLATDKLHFLCSSSYVILQMDHKAVVSFKCVHSVALKLTLISVDETFEWCAIGGHLPQINPKSAPTCIPRNPQSKDRADQSNPVQPLPSH